ncbi:THO complex subunit 7/Mft1, partial [Cinara cedri]
QIIEHRLLIDGDGTGDDRRLNILLKKFLKWSNTEYTNLNESQKVIEIMLVHANLCELAIKKSQAVSRRIDEEMSTSDGVSVEIDHNIQKIKNDIILAKEELEKAKTFKRNQMEYDVLIKNIRQYPSRDETAKRLEDLKDETQALKKARDGIAKKVNKKVNKLQVILAAIENLDESSNEDSEPETKSSEGVDDKDSAMSTETE